MTGAKTDWSLESCGGVMGVLGVGGVAPHDESMSTSSLMCEDVGVLGVVASDVG